MIDTYVVLGFTFLIIIGFGVIMLLVFRTMSSMAGNSLRADSSERRDCFQTFERLVEKTISNHAEMIAQVHRDERMHHVEQDTTVARESVKGENGRTSTPIADLPRDEVFAEPNEIDVHGSAY